MKKRFVLFVLCVSILLASSALVVQALLTSSSENYYVADDASNYSLMDVSPEEAEMVGKNYRTGELEYHKILTNDTVARSSSAKKIWTGSQSLDELNLETVTNSTRSIIEEDDRTEITDTSVTPYSGIALVMTTWSDGTAGIGTGWFVSENVLVTAAHVVYEYDDVLDENGDGIISDAEQEDGYAFEWAETVKIVPGALPVNSINTTLVNKDYYKKPYGYYTPESSYVPEIWTVNGDDRFDYAVIVLDPEEYSSPYYFPMHVTNNAVTSGVAVTGYNRVAIDDGDSNSNNNNYTFRLYRGLGSIASHANDLLEHDIDTKSGQSGAPIYISGNVVLGIHTTSDYDGDGYNEGVAINQTVYNNILGFVDE